MIVGYSSEQYSCKATGYSTEVNELDTKSGMNGTTAIGRFDWRIDALARAMLWPVLILAIAALALGSGVWTREETFSGPFPTEGPVGSLSLAAYVGQDLPAKCCLEIPSDDIANPFRSDLKLWINGVKMDQSHALHADIRRRAEGAFSHWADYVLFSLPAGVENTFETRVTIEYSVRVRALLTIYLIASAALLGLVVYRQQSRALVRRIFDRFPRGPVANLSFATIRELASVSSFLRLIAWIAFYTAALILIDASLIAAQVPGKTFKINFEYKVF